MLSREALLAAKRPQDIFSNDDAAIRQLYRELATRYHPDNTASTMDAQVMQHINMLYDQAKRKRRLGIWEEQDVLRLDTASGACICFPYFTARPFELGTYYVGKEQVLYVVDYDHASYGKRMQAALGALHYANPAMEREFCRAVPLAVAQGSLCDGRFYCTLAKGRTYYPLAALLDQQKGYLPPVHIAWIVSRLLNLACFLQFNGMTHNGIVLDACFVSPEEHGLALLGGWWYSVPVCAPMHGVCGAVYDAMTPGNRLRRVGSYTTDLECIHRLAQTLLGNPANAADRPPPAFSGWLMQSPSGDPLREFQLWNQVLHRAWGPRKFIKLDISEEAVYR